MKLTKAQRWWRFEAGCYLVSFRFDRYRAGWRRITPEAWSASLPFVIVQVIRRRRSVR